MQNHDVEVFGFGSDNILFQIPLPSISPKASLINNTLTAKKKILE